MNYFNAKFASDTGRVNKPLKVFALHVVFRLVQCMRVTI